MKRNTPPLNKTRRKCPTRKIRFPTEHEAYRSLNHHFDPEKTYHPSRVFFCVRCQGFHLTSRERTDPDAPEVFPCCGGTVGGQHELSCETVSPAEFFFRTGGRTKKEGA